MRLPESSPGSIFPRRSRQAGRGLHFCEDRSPRHPKRPGPESSSGYDASSERGLLLSSQEHPFLLTCFFVLGTRLTHGFGFADFGNRHVPPGLVARHSHLFVHFDNDHCCALLSAGRLQSSLQILSRRGADGARAEAGCVRNKVDWKVFAVELASLRISISVIRPEAIRAHSLRQSPNDAEAVIVEKDDGEFVTFLN